MRESRERLGLTQEQLAKELGLDPNSIARIERGEMQLRQIHLLALEALEKRPDTPFRRLTRALVDAATAAFPESKGVTVHDDFDREVIAFRIQLPKAPHPVFEVSRSMIEDYDPSLIVQDFMEQLRKFPTWRAQYFKGRRVQPVEVRTVQCDGVDYQVRRMQEGTTTIHAPGGKTIFPVTLGQAIRETSIFASPPSEWCTIIRRALEQGSRP
jgi:transcriptional regulator with XRE-family HTH domain